MQNWVQVVTVGEAQEGLGALPEVWGVVLSVISHCQPGGSCAQLCVLSGGEQRIHSGMEEKWKGKASYTK